MYVQFIKSVGHCDELGYLDTSYYYSCNKKCVKLNILCV